MNDIITIIVDGQEKQCPILFTYESKEFNHKYVVFRYEDTEEIGAMIYVPKDEQSGTLAMIEDDDEWEHIEEVVNQYFHDLHHHHHHDGECHCDECDGCGCDSEESCCCDHDCEHHE